MTELITPERAKEIKRAAARHAAGMIFVSLGEWDPQRYNPESARNDAEEELLREEVEQIAAELRARAVAGSTQRCGECGFPYRVKADGTMHRHTGVSLSGFSTGEPCLGVGKPPRTA